MTVKELKNKLSKYPDDLQVVICPKSANMALKIESVEETYTWDEDESPMIGLFYNL